MSDNNDAQTTHSSRTTSLKKAVTLMFTRDPLKPRWSEHVKLRAPKPRRRHKIATSIVLIAALTWVAQPAFAHGGSSEEEGYVMVQQAISYLVNEPGPGGTSEALVRVDNALAAEDQDGVDVPTLEKAKAELTAGNAEAARPILQDSINEAVTSLSSATGEETGTTTVAAPLQGDGSLSGLDWIFLALSALVALVGAGLAYRFRPTESLGALGRNISAASIRKANQSNVPSSGRDDHVR